MGNIFSSFIHEKQIDTYLIDEAVSDVIHRYVWFLRQIIDLTGDETTDDKKTSDFSTVKKEFLEFLIQHKEFYKLESIDVKLKDEVLFSLDINLGDIENTLKLSDMVKLDEKMKMVPETALVYVINYVHDQVETEIIKTIKNKLGKSFITIKDIPHFLDNYFLVDKDELQDTKFSTYKELEADIDSRINRFIEENMLYTYLVKCAFGDVIFSYVEF